MSTRCSLPKAVDYRLGVASVAAISSATNGRARASAAQPGAGPAHPPASRSSGTVIWYFGSSFPLLTSIRCRGRRLPDRSAVSRPSAAMARRVPLRWQHMVVSLQLGAGATDSRRRAHGAGNAGVRPMQRRRWCGIALAAAMPRPKFVRGLWSQTLTPLISPSSAAMSAPRRRSS